MKDFHFDAISAFENYEIEQMGDGHVVVTTKVVGRRSTTMAPMVVISLPFATRSAVWWLSRWGLME